MSSSVFSTTITEQNYEYYTIPKGYPLYKASRISKEAMNLASGKFYFFGVKNENTEYIESFEKEYGIIFEFQTGRPYKLLAMDKKKTVAELYQSAPPEIQTILTRNYGYGSGIRDSISEKDSKLSHYICSLGFDGYAIHTMKTPVGGNLHSEFMICDTSSIQSIKRVTTESVADNILAKEKLDKHAREIRKKKSTNRKFLSSPNRLFEHSGDSPSFTRKSKNLFGTSPVSSISKSPMKKTFTRSSPFTPNKSPEVKSLFGRSPSPPTKTAYETPSSSRKTKRKYTPEK